MLLIIELHLHLRLIALDNSILLCCEIILGFILLNWTFCNLFSMCIHNINVKNDVLDRPYVQLIYTTDNDNCDNLDVENKLLLNDEDFSVLQLNISRLYGKVDKLKYILSESFYYKK